MADSAKYSRLTENPATHQRSIGGRGNSGTFVRNETVNGMPYARFRAEKDTWVSASMEKLGYSRMYGKDTAFGAYTGMVLGPDGRSLSAPNRIRPGQEYLIPIPPERQESRAGRAPSSSSARIPISPERQARGLPTKEEGLSQILEFLTGRGKPKAHPSDPPPDVPLNFGERTPLYMPRFLAGPYSREGETELQRWMYEACRYNGVPVVLMAVILQQENGPGPSWITKQLQAGERESQKTAAELEEKLGVRFPGKFGKFAGGSTGIANLSCTTLRDAALYMEKMYNRPPIPDAIRKEKGDPRIAGIDEQLDLYYMSALIRQLIDRRVSVGHKGNITDEQLRLVAQDYNGSGPKAEKYGRRALARLNEARQGKTPLYFLAPPPPGEPPFHVLLDKARGLGF